MQRQRIEARVQQIADRVRRGLGVEDDLVEIKAIWPEDHHKTARQIAGHANAAVRSRSCGSLVSTSAVGRRD